METARRFWEIARMAGFPTGEGRFGRARALYHAAVKMRLGEDGGREAPSYPIGCKSPPTPPRGRWRM